MRHFLNRHANLLLTITVLAMVVSALIPAGGCNGEDPPPKPAPTPSAIKNDEDNILTRREMLVQEFQTTEVMQIPNNLSQYIIRATNGGIWYVSFDTQVGHTLLFHGTNFDDPMPFWMQSGEVDKINASLDHLHRSVKHILELQHQIAKMTNRVPMIEDPIAPK